MVPTFWEEAFERFSPAVSYPYELPAILPPTYIISFPFLFLSFSSRSTSGVTMVDENKQSKKSSDGQLTYNSSRKNRLDSFLIDSSSILWETRNYASYLSGVF